MGNDPDNTPAEGFIKILKVRVVSFDTRKQIALQNRHVINSHYIPGQSTSLCDSRCYHKLEKAGQSTRNGTSTRAIKRDSHQITL
jgi:hypothetical protein